MPPLRDGGVDDGGSSAAEEVTESMSDFSEKTIPDDVLIVEADLNRGEVAAAV